MSNSQYEWHIGGMSSMDAIQLKLYYENKMEAA